ncbi:MAG: DUF669 domain-containing protein [Lactobacillus sp.]|nr:MAG: DUF669 domain-containing protein [Lactobacillus sp.]
MSLFTVDSNNVFGMSVQEAGTYNVKVVKVQTTTTKGRGLPMLTLDVEVIDGKYKGGQIRYQNLVWDSSDEEHLETSIKRFNTFLVALGVKDGARVDSIGQIAKAAQNSQLSVETEWGEPNNSGQVYLQVRGYHPLNPDGSQPNGVKRPNAGQNPSRSISNNTSNQEIKHSTDSFGKDDGINISDSDLPF